VNFEQLYAQPMQEMMKQQEDGEAAETGNGEAAETGNGEAVPAEFSTDD
jgi:hypothetical protein